MDKLCRCRTDFCRNSLLCNPVVDDILYNINLNQTRIDGDINFREDYMDIDARKNARDQIKHRHVYFFIIVLFLVIVLLLL